ncbi:hypothetical protein SKAU_G00211310, partial [Synaphobranchus kaupii]
QNSPWPGQQTGQNSGGPVWPSQPTQPQQPVWPGQASQPTAPGWPGQNPPAPPQQSLKVPHVMKLQNGICDKMLITIKGQIKPNPNKFTINLTRGKDIAFHFNPRFNESGNKVIVRNSLLGGRWGREERALNRFPFTPGEPFELKILCTHDEFKVAVNKSHLLEYKHRVRELNTFTALGIYNDITLTSVNVDKLP